VLGSPCHQTGKKPRSLLGGRGTYLGEPMFLWFVSDLGENSGGGFTKVFQRVMFVCSSFQKKGNETKGGRAGGGLLLGQTTITGGMVNPCAKVGLGTGGGGKQTWCWGKGRTFKESSSIGRTSDDNKQNSGGRGEEESSFKKLGCVILMFGFCCSNPQVIGL